MASLFSPAAAALSLGASFYKPDIPTRVWVAGVVGIVVPDLDVIGFQFGVNSGGFWAHRGFTHALLFAALLALAVTGTAAPPWVW